MGIRAELENPKKVDLPDLSYLDSPEQKIISIPLTLDLHYSFSSDQTDMEEGEEDDRFLHHIEINETVIEDPDYLLHVLYELGKRVFEIMEEEGLY